MKEIEVKILEVDREKVEKKLIELGAKKIFEGELKAAYFDYNDMSLKKSFGILRLRKEAEKTFLTLKERISDEKTKITHEDEIEVSGFEETKKMLEKVGLKEWLRLRKRRISYRLGNVKVEFDKYFDDYDFIPEFFEIESDNENSVLECAKKLGFNEEDCTTYGFFKLADRYKKKS